MNDKLIADKTAQQEMLAMIKAKSLMLKQGDEQIEIARAQEKELKAEQKRKDAIALAAR